MPSSVELETAWYYLVVTRQLGVAAAVGVLWDFVTTTEDEVHYIWSRPKWTLPTFVYLLTRYWTLISMIVSVIVVLTPNIEDAFCNLSHQHFIEISSLIVVFTIQFIHINILRGLYGREYRVLIPVIILQVLTMGASMGVYARVVWTLRPDPLIHCAMKTHSKFFWAVWVPILVFEITAFALAYRKTQSELKTSWLLGNTSINSALKTILRDGTIYFVVIITLYLINCLFWRFAPTSIVCAPLLPTSAILSALGTRALLNIRQNAAEVSSYQALGGPDEVTFIDLNRPPPLPPSPLPSPAMIFWRPEKNMIASRLGSLGAGKSLNSNIETAPPSVYEEPRWVVEDDYAEGRRRRRRGSDDENDDDDNDDDEGEGVRMGEGYLTVRHGEVEQLRPSLDLHSLSPPSTGELTGRFERSRAPSSEVLVPDEEERLLVEHHRDMDSS